MGLLDFLKFKVRKGRLVECKLQEDVIHVPNYVESIAPHAFSLTKSSKIIIPESVELIENNSFANNEFIKEVVMSDKTLYIDNEAFWENTNLTKVTMSNKMYSLPRGVFCGCLKLKDINVSGELTSIGDRAFFRCESLTCFDFVQSLENVGKKAFSKTALEVVDLSNTRLNELKNSTFEGCSELIKFISNGNLQSIDDDCFRDCKKLEVVIFNESQDDDKGLNVIGSGCFAHCSLLKDISLPNSVNVLKKDAFKGCASLEKMVIPMGVKTIFSETFSNCSSLKKVVFENYDVTIGKGTFNFCDNLSEIVYKGNLINVKNIDPNSIDNETLDFLLLNQNDIKNIECKVNLDIITLLKSKNLFKDFCTNAYYKNYRYLYKLLFKDNDGSSKDRKAFFVFCYKLGVFTRDFSQKSTGIIESLIENKLLTQLRVYMELDKLSLMEIDEEMIKEVTFNNGEFLRDIFMYSNNNIGFACKCLENYQKVQFTNTQNKGKHKRLKPTLQKFVNFFKEDKFKNIESSDDEKLAIEIGKFFDKQDIYDTAKMIMQRYKSEGVVDSLIDEKYRKEIIEKIKEEKVRYLKNDEEVSELLSKFYYEFLKKDDCINFTIGKYCSDCCGHIGGNGENLCFASILDENTQTLVIRNGFGEIVSKATFSINKKHHAMILNSIQINENLIRYNHQILANKYVDAIKIFLKEYNQAHDDNIYKALLATRSSMLVDCFEDNDDFCPSIDYNKYSLGKKYEGDWDGRQICLYQTKIISKNNIL